MRDQDASAMDEIQHAIPLYELRSNRLPSTISAAWTAATGFRNDWKRAYFVGTLESQLTSPKEPEDKSKEKSLPTQARFCKFIDDAYACHLRDNIDIASKTGADKLKIAASRLAKSYARSEYLRQSTLGLRTELDYEFQSAQYCCQRYQESSQAFLTTARGGDSMRALSWAHALAEVEAFGARMERIRLLEDDLLSRELAEQKQQKALWDALKDLSALCDPTEATLIPAPWDLSSGLLSPISCTHNAGEWITDGKAEYLVHDSSEMTWFARLIRYVHRKGLAKLLKIGAAFWMVSCLPTTVAADSGTRAAVMATIHRHSMLSNICWISGAVITGLAMSYSIVQSLAPEDVTPRLRVGVFSGWLVSCGVFVPATLARFRLLGPITLLMTALLVMIGPCIIAMARDRARASDAILAFGTYAILATLFAGYVLQQFARWSSPRLQGLLLALAGPEDVHEA